MIEDQWSRVKVIERDSQWESQWEWANERDKSHWEKYSLCKNERGREKRMQELWERQRVRERECIWETDKEKARVNERKFNLLVCPFPVFIWWLYWQHNLYQWKHGCRCLVCYWHKTAAKQFKISARK